MRELSEESPRGHLLCFTPASSHSEKKILKNKQLREKVKSVKFLYTSTHLITNNVILISLIYLHHTGADLCGAQQVS